MKRKKSDRAKSMKSEEELTEEDVAAALAEGKNAPFFVDRWCAKNVRKVSFCQECLHYGECLKAGKSLSPAAQNRKGKTREELGLVSKDGFDEENEKELRYTDLRFF